MQGPNKMVGIDAESRSTPGPNSPANDTSLSKKRRMNWDEVPGQNTNDGNAPGKDHLQMERRKMGKKFSFVLLVTQLTSDYLQKDTTAGIFLANLYYYAVI